MSGHMKKKCSKYHAWRERKGTFHILVCPEVHLTSVPRNTWWLDSDTTINISVSMQDFLNYRKPNDVERYIYVGDGKLVEVKAIWNFRLLMRTRFHLEKDTFVVLSFRQNLFF